MADKTPAAYAVTLDGYLYGYGPNEMAAIGAFKFQIMGASRAMQGHMLARAVIVPLTADEASETVECMLAPW